MNDTSNPKVFISYSWTSSDKVVELSERLMSNGVEVILDKWDLKEGQDKYAFMEQSVNDPTVDKVLIICDKAYAEKANLREGGVGDETVIISPEIYGEVKQEKFIPIIFEIDSDGNPYRPAYIKSRIYIDLSTEDDRYESNYEALLRNLHNKPLYRKPALGSIPEWLENENVDLSPIRDLVKQVRGYTSGNEVKADFLIRKCVGEFIEALRSLGQREEDLPDEVILQKVEESKPLRDLYVEFLEAVIYNGFDISTVIPDFFEQVYNTTHDAVGKRSYSEDEFEFFDFFIWETFICTTAILLHYERFGELNKVLTHTYFLKESGFSSTLKANNYVIFRQYFRTIDGVCKTKSNEPRLYTLAGNILVAREKKPLITKMSLSNADLVLYQMSRIFELTKNDRWYWFPLLYCYHHGLQSIWTKLESRKYCEKIMLLFGVSSVDSLKQKICSDTFDEKIRYQESFDSAPVIHSNIKIEAIGTLN